jgi:hypothetical protein
MSWLIGSRAGVTGLVAGFLLSAGCADMGKKSPTPQSLAPRGGATLAGGNWFLIISDGNGNMLGGAPVVVTESMDTISFKRSAIIEPEDIRNRPPDRMFISEFSNITFFKMYNTNWCWRVQGAYLIRYEC